MTPLTLREARHAVGGRALSIIADENIPIKSVSIDSRHIEPGGLFIAIRGETFDGHAFVASAAAQGAVAAIVESAPDAAASTSGVAALPPGFPLVQVANTRIALGRLARHVRQGFRGKVIAVAGSNGKTSTKHLIHAALRAKLKGSISPKSYNNDIGVPLSIFPTDPHQDYLVLEIGTNHPGEIKPLSDMAMPDIAVLTNCGADHLEGLGDLAGVRRENAEIISGLNPKGLLIVNGDDLELLSAVKDWAGRKLTFGLKPSNDIFATNIVCTLGGTEFSLNNRPARVRTPMLGRHSAINALAAIAVARSLRLSEESVIESLAGADGPDMRMQVQQAADVTILNDAYNANPNSMAAGIDTLAALQTTGRRVAILGDMRELGEGADQYHREIGQHVAGLGIDVLVCVGEKAALMADAAIAAGMAGTAVVRFVDAGQAASGAAALLRPGDLVLLKASRGMRLEQIAAALGA